MAPAIHPVSERYRNQVTVSESRPLWAVAATDVAAAAQRVYQSLKVKAMKLGIAIDPREPFSLYTLAMAKQDSERNLKPRRERQERVARWSEFGMYIITIAYLVGWTGIAIRSRV